MHRGPSRNRNASLVGCMVVGSLQFALVGLGREGSRVASGLGDAVAVTLVGRTACCRLW